MRGTSIAILFLVVAANLGLWSWAGRQFDGPDWSGELRGVSFNPYRRGEDPLDNVHPSPKEIDEDLQFLEGRVERVRTYSSLDDLDLVPYLARSYNIKVTAGAWLDTRVERNWREVQHLVAAIQDNRRVDSAIVGNEALLREDMTVEELGAYLDWVRARVRVPVSTAEPWHVWLEYPELVEKVDFVAVHILPYWEGLSPSQAIGFIDNRVQLLRQTFPGKRILLSEVGWPSDGTIIGNAVPSPANQALFLRSFLDYAEQNDVDYFVMEAFDQPWKAEIEGTVGSYWGIFDVDRQPKVAWSGPVTNLPAWPILFALSSILALTPTIFFLRRASGLDFQGRLLVAVLIQLSVTVLTWAAQVAISRYATPLSSAGWLAIGAGMAFLFTVILVEGLELAEALWLRRRRHFAAKAPSPLPERAPRVSIHLPIYNEPPAMVKQTLQALANLDYPDFEVLVIDNNTVDPAVWRPVEDYCRELGERFRFFHLDRCPGFKAGALNFALGNTDPNAEVVGVIDSDYIVERDWLKNLVPYFGDPAVGFVQAPQDYRDAGESRFKEMCFWEYAGFFHVGMVQRNERNAIIQHGTMTLIRRSALERVCAWGEWCITEDAELGLRFFEDGWESVYVHHSYGRGLMPDDLGGYKRQRFRWAYGAIQIMKRHLSALLLPGKTRLDLGQRFHFFGGWLPWLADALNLIFVTLALGWSVGLVLLPRSIDFPFLAAIAVALSLFLFKIVKSLLLYRFTVGTSLKQSVGAALAGLALSYTVGKAVLTGFATSRQPFLRTPKCADKPLFVQALATVWEEAVLLLLLLSAAVAVAIVHGERGLVPALWVAMLLVQALPFAASLAAAMIATLPPRERREEAVPVAAPAAAPVADPARP